MPYGDESFQPETRAKAAAAICPTHESLLSWERAVIRAAYHAGDDDYDRATATYRPAKTVSDLVHDRRDAEREDDDRREEARDARARGEE